MAIPFWSNDPNILFNKEYIFELWPSPNMSYEQKLNSITRLIILFTILGYIFTMSLRILVVGLITVGIIYLLFTMKKTKVTSSLINNVDNVEGFNNLFQQDSSNNEIIDPTNLNTILKEGFKEGTRKNPFSNVLLTQIGDEPDRKSAPPSFNTVVDKSITDNVKQAVQCLNPDIKNTNKQIFGDLWENFELDNSNRVFYSTPNTKVVNDQGAFAQYLYNDLKYSAKESTPEGAIARVQDNYRYTLY